MRMSNFNGTPGRWIKRGDGIVAPGDIEVAVVVNFHDDEAMDADANLIAAAPELLEALETLVVFTTPTKRNSAALSKAYAAIAKALGESK